MIMDYSGQVKIDHIILEPVKALLFGLGRVLF